MNESSQNNNYAWYNGKSINERLFCEEFLRDHPMVCAGGRFFTREGCIFNEDELRREIYSRLRTVIDTRLDYYTRSLIEALRLEAYISELPLCEDRIHLGNGTFYLHGGFKSELEYCRNRLPILYNPKAPRPERWLAFLDDLLNPDDILTLQEYLGYCLIPTTRAQCMMILRGTGGEGKSRIGVVMKNLLGSNMKNGSIEKVEHNPFARADLENILLMVDDDMQMEALKSTHNLKTMITADSPLDLERKGVQSYQGSVYARFLAFSNGDLEALYDHSFGFFRRQLIISVKKRPSDRVDDPFLSEKLLEELEGIFLWCLVGLYRLIENNYRFTVSSRTLENLEETRRDADNVLSFLRSDGYFRFKADSAITSADLYDIYLTWCLDNSIKPYAARTMLHLVKTHSQEFNLEHSNHIENSRGKQVNGFLGIAM